MTGNLSETGQVCVVGHYYFSRIFCNNLSPSVPGCSLPPQELQQAVPQREAASDARQALPPEYNQLVAHSPSVTDLAFLRTRLGQNFQVRGQEKYLGKYVGRGRFVWN